MDFAAAAGTLMDALRLRTYPVAVRFTDSAADFPEKTRRPFRDLNKRITICMGVTMARNYGWTVGLTKEDLVCVPALIAFGMSPATSAARELAGLFCKVAFHKEPSAAEAETGSMALADGRRNGGILLSPLSKGAFTPDAVAVYGNPAQVMRMVQALVWATGKRIAGNFGGKVECTEYLLAPVQTGAPRISAPGMGDRVFSMTQDDEMVISLPASDLSGLLEGLREAGKKAGARYPAPFYQMFEPAFPKPYKELADDLGLFDFDK